MDKSEIIERLKNIAGYAIHTTGEKPFVMSLDDGIAVHEAIELLTNCPEIPDSWIPFKTRPLTEEEKEEHPEWDCVLDCELPDDGQEILITYKNGNKKMVSEDTFFNDDGCYLDSGLELGEDVLAWAEKPEPWKGEKADGQN